MSGCGFAPKGWPGTRSAAATAAQKLFVPGVVAENRACALTGKLRPCFTYLPKTAATTPPP